VVLICWRTGGLEALQLNKSAARAEFLDDALELNLDCFF
jgi:hypothetical protein